MSFSEDFIWGAATASYQVEGAYDEDGKGPGIWDVMSDGHVAHGDSARVSSDHYHHFREDVKLMKDLGIRAYRFSISWPRVIPEEGVVNEQGLSFYSELVDELINSGITPLCTLYHWDLPMWAHEKGGWLGETISDDFADYVRVVTERLSDRISHWMTFNEGTSFIGEGYLHGNHPPYMKVEAGSEEERRIILKASRNLLLAHGKAAKILREHAVLPPAIGIATDSTLYMPNSENTDDIEEARAKTFADDVSLYRLNWWLDPIMNNRFHPALSEIFTDEEKETICQPLDFIGWNCYQANNYNDGPDGKMQKSWPGVPRNDMGWPITRDALYWGVRFIWERYHAPIMITENGFPNVDFVYDDGKVHDPQRIQYLTWYLKGLKRAVDEGCSVIGYMVWSLLDNFEWAFGLSKRFGLIYVDYRTGERIPKDSYYWYADTILHNGDDL